MEPSERKTGKIRYEEGNKQIRDTRRKILFCRTTSPDNRWVSSHRIYTAKPLSPDANHLRDLHALPSQVYLVPPDISPVRRSLAIMCSNSTMGMLPKLLKQAWQPGSLANATRETPPSKRIAGASWPACSPGTLRSSSPVVEQAAKLHLRRSFWPGREDSWTSEWVPINGPPPSINHMARRVFVPHLHFQEVPGLARGKVMVLP
ncbi:hypothetical protein F4810DRAFT_29239 [Camillea tinctor]|nr:hypothetical protein F4810DRAFT_29239 [Camillea tinctor]